MSYLIWDTENAISVQSPIETHPDKACFVYKVTKKF